MFIVCSNMPKQIPGSVNLLGNKNNSYSDSDSGMLHKAMKKNKPSKATYSFGL